MQDDVKTKAELLQEVEALRRRIAELEQAEEALRVSQQQKRAILDSIPDIAWLKDKEGIYIAANESLCQAFGMKLEDLIGKTDFDISPEDLAKRYRDDDQEVMKSGKRKRIEEPWGKKKGKRIWIETIKTPIYNNKGEVIGTSGIARDITERKKAEEALKESEEKYRDIVEKEKDIIYTLDEKGNITFASPAVETILGYRPEEVIGKHFIVLIPKEWHEKTEADFNNLLKEGEITAETVLLDKQGQAHFVEYASTIIREGNKVTGTRGIVRDITEHKKAAEALRKSEQKYHSLVTNIPDVVWTTDSKGNTTFISPNIEKVYGYNQEEIYKEGDRLWFGRIHPDDIARVKDAYKALFEKRTPFDIEYRIKRKDGEWIWLHDRSIVTYEKDGVMYADGVFSDTTERKQAEDVLRESEERYKALFQGAAEGILVADIETKQFKYANPAICKMLGYTEEELERLGMRDIHTKEDLQYIISEFNAQAQGEKTLSSSIPCLQKDGTIVHADINSARVLIDGRQCIVGFFADVTERKKGEDALRESENKYKTLLENLPQKVFLKDTNSVYVSCNENLAKDLGIKSEQIAGKTDYDFLPKELAEKYRADDKRIMQSGETEAIEEKYIQQGQEIIVHTVKTPVKDGQDNVIGILGIFWDITEHKKVEEELNEYREKMARTEQLASLGTLSATLAHELNQPLTTIRLSIENSLADLETTSCPDTITEGLKDGLTGVSHAASIVERFRNFATKSSEKIVGQVDLKAVAERIVNLLNESTRRAKVSLRLKGMDKLPPVYCNEKDLEQLFFALVDNAIQAADGKKSRQLIISGAVKDKQIELRFADDCGGIATKNLDKIFEPFFTTRPAGEGTGLGLCVVQRIVSRAGGKVRVESEPGKGSTFFVTLPIDGGKRS